jgi:cytochrome P450
LVWVFYELHHHPECEKLVREEAQRVLGDAAPTYADLKNLRYTQAVFNETLRLHSNVPMNIKTCRKDCILPGTKTQVYEGDIITFSSWLMGRTESIWGPDAKQFKPERWLVADGAGNVSLKKENQFKYPVFNAGPRVCLGQSMATQEAVVFISSIVNKYHLELVNEDEPRKWGMWSELPEERKGRYVIALTLGLRGGMDFLVHAV